MGQGARVGLSVLALDALRDADSDALFDWINDRELVELSAVFRPVSRAEHETWFADVRARSDVAIWAIREDGALVGTGQLLIDGDAAELRIRIGVRSAQDRGIGTWTVRELVRRGFEELGLRRIWLQVLEANARAIRAYEKAGFETVDGGSLRIMEIRRAAA